MFTQRRSYYLVLDDQPRAAFALADVVRDESRSAVARLQEMGMQVAVLMSVSTVIVALNAQLLRRLELCR